MRLYKRGKYWWVAWPGDERESTKCTGAAAAERWAKREELRRADPAHAAARSIASACEALKIAHVSWNDLRRTHARWLRRAGVDPELIGEQLRHTSPAMARRVYAQITPGELGEQIERRLRDDP